MFNQNIRCISYLVLAVGLFLVPGSVFAQEAAADELPVFEIYDAQTFEKQGEIELPVHYDRLSFQVADMGIDGQAEIIMGAPSGELPEVIFLRSDGSEITRFQAYTENYRGGVVVAVSDADHDGVNDVVTGTRESGGPHIRIFNTSGRILSEWFAYDPGSRAGVTLAVGDVSDKYDGDEIIVAHGEGQQTLLRVFSFYGDLISEWFPFGEEYYGGVNMDISPDGMIVVSRAHGKSPMVRTFSYLGSLESEFLAYYEGFEGGVQVQTIAQPQGGWNIYSVPGYSGGPHIRNFSTDGRALSPGFMAYGGEYKGGLIFDDGDIDGDGDIELVIAKEIITPVPNGTMKSIVVDLSEQTLYTYYRGNLLKSYLVSTGKWGFTTPTGTFAVSRKRESTNMSWFYGEGNPNNYDLDDVPHVLTFLGPYTIHGTYWHNNFGQVMSHGCVNMALDDAEEVYYWADMGTMVIIKE